MNSLWRVGLLLSLSVFGYSVEARQIQLPPADTSAYADTEVTTNLVFNRNPTLRGVEISFRLDSCPSNNVQAAFGRDADADGVLSPDETDTVFGARNGRWFAEKVSCGERIEEAMSSHLPNRRLTISVTLSRGCLVKRFAAADEEGKSVFAPLSENPPDWTYRKDWNLMRVTRRGPGVPAEWFTCDEKAAYFQLIVR